MTESWEWRQAPLADFAVIGDPVAHSLSPQMHGAAYRILGLPFRYVAIRVPPGEVAQALEFLREIGYRGINVTVPHKEEALEWAEVADPFARQVRAANTFDLPLRSCINTDALGFMRTLEPYTFWKKRALIVGAGGSARALATALVTAGWVVSIYNRTPAKAVELAELVGATALETADPFDASIIVNTTSASLHGSELPILWDRVWEGALAYDLMYTFGLTTFLRLAAERRLRTIDGLPLLVAQGALSFEWWFGTTAPREVMMNAVRTSV